MLGIGNGRHQGDRHCLGDLVLQRENVGEIAVVAFGPDVIASFGLHELRGYADPIAGFAHATFEHIAYPQFEPHLLYIDCSTLEGERRIARYDEQRRIT